MIDFCSIKRRATKRTLEYKKDTCKPEEKKVKKRVKTTVHVKIKNQPKVKEEIKTRKPDVKEEFTDSGKIVVEICLLFK